MNVLFCNIAWMKYYNGVTEDDKPKNGGAYVNENEYGNECFNFEDHNGKCYGYVMLYGDMNLEAHFKGIKKHQDFLEDALVVWVATNGSNETRIVGWYKDATVYRSPQYQQAFTNENFDLCYNIVADSKNCYLIPERERNFHIQRAAQTGKGTGMGRSNVWYAESPYARTVLIPSVIEYIDNYKGKYANTVYNNEILCEVLKDFKLSSDFQKICDEGVKCLEQDRKMEALKLFNTARLIRETPKVLCYIAESLTSLSCFDKAISIYNNVIELKENEEDALMGLIVCYDYTGNREKTIEYCNRLISLLDVSKDDIELAVYYHCVVFDIYIFLRNEKKAREVIDRVAAYPNDDEVKNCVNEMQRIIKEEFKE